MQLFNPYVTEKALGHAGTFNNNVFTMSAAVVASRIVTKDAIDRLNGLGDKLREGGNRILEEAGLTSIHLTGFGSGVGFWCRDETDDDRLLFEALFFYLLQKGVQIGRRGFAFINLAHEEEHVDRLLRSIGEFAQEVTKR